MRTMTLVLLPPGRGRGGDGGDVGAGAERLFFERAEEFFEPDPVDGGAA